MTVVPPLAGFTVGITAARRAEELAALFVRRGANVRRGPAVRLVPLADDTELRAATTVLLDRPVDIVVVTTDAGFREWIAAADSWGIGAELRAGLSAATVLPRGPKAAGAVRAIGLSEDRSSSVESHTGLLRHLLAAGVAGRRIAVQLPGRPRCGFVAALRRSGAEVVEIPVYRWAGPADPAPLDRLIDGVLGGAVDALPFTSALAASGTLARAHSTGRREALLAALRRSVLVTCVGPATAAPLEAAGVPTTPAVTGTVGALAHTTSAALMGRARTLCVAGRDVEVRGQGVVVDGEPREVPQASMAVLRELVEEPGRVVSRRELRAVLPNGGEEHAVETAVGRLRAALGDSTLVRTVVKRGYRLAVDPAARPVSRRPVAAEPAGEPS